jgi:hypothetical protein
MSTLNKVFVHLIVIAFSGSTNAALTMADGLDVSFTNDHSPAGFFGKPVVSGDTLTFAPVNFSSSRESMSGTENTNSPIKAITAPFPQTAFVGNTGTWHANANAAFINSFSGEALIHSILVMESAGLDGFASFKNTLVGLTARVSEVPLHLAVWLFGAGLMGFLSIAKRKKLL